MPTPTTLFAMNTTTVKFTGADGEEHDFSDHINTLSFNPSKGASVPVVSGKKYSGHSTWTVQLGLVQDIDPSGLLRFLMEFEGEKMRLDATFVEGTDTLQVDVNISPAGIGGPAGTDLPTSSVDLDADGKPQWVAAE